MHKTMIPPCFKTTPYFSNPFLFMEKIWTSPFCKTFENSIPLYKAVGFNCETMVAPVAPEYISFDDVLLGTCWHPQVHWTASHLIVLKIWISPVYSFFSLKFLAYSLSFLDFLLSELVCIVLNTTFTVSEMIIDFKMKTCHR